MMKKYDDMLSRFHLVRERNGQTDRQTDGQTDRQICYINIAHQHTALLTRDKNGVPWKLIPCVNDTIRKKCLQISLEQYGYANL